MEEDSGWIIRQSTQLQLRTDGHSHRPKRQTAPARFHSRPRARHLRKRLFRIGHFCGVFRALTGLARLNPTFTTLKTQCFTHSRHSASLCSESEGGTNGVIGTSGSTRSPDALTAPAMLFYSCWPRHLELGLTSSGAAALLGDERAEAVDVRLGIALNVGAQLLA